MRIIDLNGQSKNWKISGKLLSANFRRTVRSNLHLTTKKLLIELFPTFKIIEEVPIPIRDHEILYFDFYIILRETAIEVQGQQHFQFIPFFHHDLQGFIRQKQNDKAKKEWCELNNINLITLLYNETTDEWRNRFN